LINIEEKLDELPKSNYILLLLIPLIILGMSMKYKLYDKYLEKLEKEKTKIIKIKEYNNLYSSIKDDVIEKKLEKETINLRTIRSSVKSKDDFLSSKSNELKVFFINENRWVKIAKTVVEEAVKNSLEVSLIENIQISYEEINRIKEKEKKSTNKMISAIKIKGASTFFKIMKFINVLETYKFIYLYKFDYFYDDKDKLNFEIIFNFKEVKVK